MGNTAALLKPQGALETLNRVRIIENVRNKLVASVLGSYATFGGLSLAIRLHSEHYKSRAVD